MAYDFSEFDNRQKFILDFLSGKSPYISADTEQQPTPEQFTGGLLGDIQIPQPQQATQQPAPKEERLSATEQINEGILKSTPLQQLTTTDQIPNPYALGQMRGVAANKLAYELAPEGEKGDYQRKLASTQADLIRQQMEAAGYDMSQFGANNATFRDVYQRLEAQKARDILEATQGKYAKTADQFYTDSYYENLALGYSPRQARKFAGNRAKEYQAERVGYLRAVYNAHGRDGYATNEIGADLLASIGQENPALANFFGALYPSPKDSYARQNQIEDKAIDQNNALAQLALSHGYGLENMSMANYYNLLQQLFSGEIDLRKIGYRSQLEEEHADNEVERYKLREAFNTDQQIRAYGEKLKLEYGQWFNQLEETQRRAKLEPSAVTKTFKEGLELAELKGLKGDEAGKFAAEYAQLKFIGTEKGKDYGVTQKNYDDLAKSLVDQKKAIIDQYKDSLGEMSEEDKALLANIDRQLDNVNSIRNQRLGLPNENMNIVWVENDEEANIDNIAQLIWYGNEKGKSEQEIWSTIRAYVPADRTDRFVDLLIDKAAAKMGVPQK